MGIKKDKTNLTQLLTVLKYQFNDIGLHSVDSNNDNIIIIDNTFYCHNGSEIIFSLTIENLVYYEISGIFGINAKKLYEVLKVCDKPRLEFNKTNSYKKFPLLEIKDGGGVWYFPFTDLSVNNYLSDNENFTPVKMVSTNEMEFKKTDFNIFFDCELKAMSSNNYIFPCISIGKDCEIITNSFLLQTSPTKLYDCIGDCRIFLKDLTKFKPIFQNLFGDIITVKNCGDYVAFESNGIEVNLRKQDNQSFTISNILQDIDTLKTSPKQEIELNKKEFKTFFKSIKAKDKSILQCVFGNQKVTIKDDYSYKYELPIKTKELYNYFTRQVCINIGALITSFDLPDSIKIYLDRDNLKSFYTVDNDNNIIYGKLIDLN